jgi:hypothetical protein
VSLPMETRVQAMQLMEDCVGDGKTITEADVHDYFTQRN